MTDASRTHKGECWSGGANARKRHSRLGGQSSKEKEGKERGQTDAEDSEDFARFSVFDLGCTGFSHPAECR